MVWKTILLTQQKTSSCYDSLRVKIAFSISTPFFEIECSRSHCSISMVYWKTKNNLHPISYLIDEHIVGLWGELVRRMRHACKQNKKKHNCEFRWIGVLYIIAARRTGSCSMDCINGGHMSCALFIRNWLFRRRSICGGCGTKIASTRSVEVCCTWHVVATQREPVRIVIFSIAYMRPSHWPARMQRITNVTN